MRRSSRAVIIVNYQPIKSQRSLIRAKILREVVDDIYKKHYFPVTKESSIMFEYDRNKDEIKESACRLEETAWYAEERFRHVNVHQQTGEMVDGHRMWS